MAGLLFILCVLFVQTLSTFIDDVENALGQNITVSELGCLEYAANAAACVEDSSCVFAFEQKFQVTVVNANDTIVYQNLDYTGLCLPGSTYLTGKSLSMTQWSPNLLNVRWSSGMRFCWLTCTEGFSPIRGAEYWDMWLFLIILLAVLLLVVTIVACGVTWGVGGFIICKIRKAMPEPPSE